VHKVFFFETFVVEYFYWIFFKNMAIFGTILNKIMHWLCLFLCLKVRTICATHCNHNGEIRNFPAMAECTVIVSKVFAKNCGQAHDHIPNIFPHICFRFSRKRVQNMGLALWFLDYKKNYLQRIEIFSQNLTKIVPKNLGNFLANLHLSCQISR